MQFVRPSFDQIWPEKIFNWPPPQNKLSPKTFFRCEVGAEIFEFSFCQRDFDFLKCSSLDHRLTRFDQKKFSFDHPPQKKLSPKNVFPLRSWRRKFRISNFFKCCSLDHRLTRFDQKKFSFDHAPKKSYPQKTFSPCEVGAVNFEFPIFLNAVR